MTVSGASKKAVLVVVRDSPYGSSLSRAALDAALAAAAFEQPVELLFVGDGVLHLLPGQESAAIGLRNAGKLLASLPLYDIEAVYADRVAADRYGIALSAAPVEVRAVDTAGIRALIDASDHVLGF